MAFHVWQKALGCTTFQPHWKAFFNPKAPLLAQKNDALRLSRAAITTSEDWFKFFEYLASPSPVSGLNQNSIQHHVETVHFVPFLQLAFLRSALA